MPAAPVTMAGHHVDMVEPVIGKIEGERLLTFVGARLFLRVSAGRGGTRLLNQASQTYLRREAAHRR